MTTENMTAGMTERIAAFAVDRYPEPPASALDVARLSLMDWAAVAIAGIDEPVARILRELVAEEAGAAQSTVIGLDQRLPARAAALANGAVSHALDYDDTHFAYVGHPSVVVFPAALAMAERLDQSGAMVLEAALIGMEAACRIGHWLGTGHYNHGFHQTATAGAFGATIAAGRLLGLDQHTMRHALGLCATRASGLKSQFGTMGKPFNAGIAAANGIEAATLAAAGLVSRPDGLECVQGFADTHAGECRNGDASLASLPDHYWFEAVQHKFHACCHGTHAALDALAHLKATAKIDPEALAKVAITINPRWLRVCDIATPTTGLEAKFSYRLTAAMALAGLSTAALATFSDDACADPALIALRDRVEVKGDSSVSDTAAKVVLVSRDGVTEAAEVDLDTPLPFVVRHQRIDAKIQALLSPEAATEVCGLFAAVDSIGARDLGISLTRLAMAERKRRAP